MNVYVVTEGQVETAVYKQWIPFINPNLSLVDRIDDVKDDRFYVISANGYPQYFKIIENAIADINHLKVFDRLVICVDSEDMTKHDKFDEIDEFVRDKQCAAQIRIVIQHFSIEAWALGNRKIIRSNPASRRLREYKRLHNVGKEDPELLPPNHEEDLNRAQFAERYLRFALNDRFRNLTYTKKNPDVLLHEKYFEQLKNRLEQTGHIASFYDFLQAFV
ncbi:MAG: hypothetical protein GWP17_00960 [Aquificales bacterium]|nr:hypothetical protein [Aquificales bacterium]